ncbi:MAG: tRNA adenosine(34) deaminase TadA [Arenimonas sp.]
MSPRASGPQLSGEEFSERDLHWMQRALELADRAQREDGEIPVGAVLVAADGAELAAGWNRNIAEHDPTAHAEVVAMRKAGQRLGNHRLLGATLYVTLEPCAMCAMAMVHARVARVVFAASDPKTGACGSVFDLLADPRHNHRVQVQGGLLAAEAGKRLSDFFRSKRKSGEE